MSFMGKRRQSWKRKRAGDRPPAVAITAVPGLVQWFKADDGPTSDTGGSTPQTTNAGAVASWLDRSGANRPLVQVSSGQNPTVRTNQQNGMQIVRFSANAMYRPDGISNNGNPAAGGLSTFTMFMMMKFNATPSNMILWGQGWNGGNARIRFSSNTGLFVQDNASSNFTLTVPELNTSPARFAVYCLRRSGASYQWYVDNVLKASSDAGPTGVVHLSHLADENPTGSRLQADVGEIIWYTGALTASQREGVSETIRSRWGLA